MIKNKFSLEIVDHKLKDYKFEKDELWSYDPFHVIYDIRKSYSWSIYEHTSKLALEKLENQEFYLREIDQFEVFENIEKDSSIEKNMSKLSIQTQGLETKSKVYQFEKRMLELDLEEIQGKKMKLTIQSYVIELHEVDVEAKNMIRESHELLIKY